MRPSSTATSAVRGGARCRRRACRRGSRARAWVPQKRASRSDHHRTAQMCSTRVAIFERSGDTATHAADLAADRAGRRHHGAAGRAARRAPHAGRAHPPAGGEQVDRPRHPHQPRPPPAGCCATPPARPTGSVRRWSRSGGSAVGLVPRPRLRPPVLVELSLELGATCAALGVGDDTVTVLDQVADPRAARQRVPGGRVVPAAASAGCRGRGVGAGRGARRLARPRPRRHARPLRRRARRHPRPWVRGGDRGHARGARPRARGHARRRHLGPAPRSTASPTSSPPTRSSSRSTLDPDREYAVNVVNAPVFDHTGHVTLVLSLTGFARPLRGDEVLRRRRAPRRRHHPPHRRACSPTALARTSRRSTTDHRGGPSDASRWASGQWRGWRVSRPERSSVPLRASVSVPSRTIGVPFTRTWSMPSASA